MWSHLPSRISAKERTVSSMETYTPGVPVKTSATWNGWPRNFWILAGAVDGELLVLGKLVHAQDGDDVLQVLVLLQDLLHADRHAVVLLADDFRVEGARGGLERVDRGVDAELGDGARQNRLGVEVGERRGRGRVGQVVGGHVDGLHRGDGPGGGGADALLQVAHLGCQRGLVAHGGRHAAQKGGNLGAGLREAEDVVDEQQHVLALVTEVLRLGQACEANAETGSGRLVHLTVDQAGLLDDAGLGHLEVKVGALTGALAHAGEHRGAAVLLGEVVDEFLDGDRLADACAAEQAGLAALDVGLESGRRP